MKLTNAAKNIDYYPVTSAGKSFVRRVVWHPGSETELTSFSTITKIDMIYDANQYIINGATVVDFNLQPYSGKDYNPMNGAC